MPQQQQARSLFDEVPAGCTCHRTGYCPVHGDYTPAVQDPEVLVAFAEAQAARRKRDARVVRKELPS